MTPLASAGKRKLSRRIISMMMLTPPPNAEVKLSRSDATLSSRSLLLPAIARAGTCAPHAAEVGSYFSAEPLPLADSRDRLACVVDAHRGDDLVAHAIAQGTALGRYQSLRRAGLPDLLRTAAGWRDVIGLRPGMKIPPGPGSKALGRASPHPELSRRSFPPLWFWRRLLMRIPRKGSAVGPCPLRARRSALQ